jgi:hypothetical protein
LRQIIWQKTSEIRIKEIWVSPENLHFSFFRQITKKKVRNFFKIRERRKKGKERKVRSEGKKKQHWEHRKMDEHTDP